MNLHFLFMLTRDINMTIYVSVKMYSEVEGINAVLFFCVISCDYCSCVNTTGQNHLEIKQYLLAFLELL